MAVVPLAEDKVAAIRIPERHPSSLSCRELCCPCSLCLGNLPGVILTAVILFDHRLSLLVREVEFFIRFGLRAFIMQTPVAVVVGSLVHNLAEG